MLTHVRFVFMLVLVLGFTAISTSAQEKSAPPTGEAKVSTTQHTGRFNSQTINYTATAGETTVTDADGKPVASIFSVAYTKNNAGDPATRPVVFIYNGGPGSAALWLHMGAFGPKRLDWPDNPEDDGAPPYTLVDNTGTILDVADLVFIDPVGTGYSQPLGEHAGSEFWGITEDARSIAAFIRQWITDNQRWASPKYLAGESYGTVRSSAVADQLNRPYNNVALNGVILIASLQSLLDVRPNVDNDRPYAVYLPTYAAAAWYHGKAGQGKTLQDFVDEARDFVFNNYVEALYKGNKLDADAYDAIVQQLAYFTGLSEKYIRQTNLRIDPRRFMKELLRDEGLAVGRLDARFTGKDFDDAGEQPDADPSSYGIDAAFTAVYNDYMQRTLNVSMDRPYETLSFSVNQRWNYTAENNPTIVSVADYLGQAMRQNQDLRILVASGYYDLATPFFMSENSFIRAGNVPDRISYTYYESGHMMYIHAPSRVKFLQDIRAFIEAGG